MAGIEKCCEACDAYPGWEMYGLKYNQLQVCRDCRKKFKGQEAVLHIFSGEDIELWRYPQKNRTVYRRDYVLNVPGVPGNVGGDYMNWSHQMSTVKRKLKRLLRCRELKVVKHQESYGDWLQRKRNEERIPG